MMEQKELCIRCGKPTPYHPDTPITIRRYYVEGAGQLCEECWLKQYGEVETVEHNGVVKMPSLAMYNITPPKDPAEFEKICMDYLSHKYDADASIYGRMLFTPILIAKLIVIFQIHDKMTE